MNDQTRLLAEYGVAKITLDEQGQWNIYYSKQSENGTMGKGHSKTFDLEDLMIILKRKLITNKPDYAEIVKSISEDI